MYSLEHSLQTIVLQLCHEDTKFLTSPYLISYTVTAFQYTYFLLLSMMQMIGHACWSLEDETADVYLEPISPEEIVKIFP